MDACRPPSPRLALPQPLRPCRQAIRSAARAAHAAAPASEHPVLGPVKPLLVLDGGPWDKVEVVIPKSGKPKASTASAPTAVQLAAQRSTCSGTHL